MRLNEDTAICTPSVLLVPYEAHHVPRYHSWMKSEELQTLTASEPLTLEEEYAMQRAWRDDADKLTFIACLPPEKEPGLEIVAGMEDVEDRMIGDVNLFLSVGYEVDADGEEMLDRPFVNGEAELMIARPEYRGRGLGRAVLLAFLEYVRRHVGEIVGEFAAGEHMAGILDQ